MLSSPPVKQLVRDPKAAGSVRVAEVPDPALLPGTVLVRTRFSAVSPATERNMAAGGLGGAVASVRERPDLVGRVIGMARRDGVRATWERVRARLGETRPLGSSSAGVVIAVSPEAAEAGLRAGQLVACTGSGLAIHGEIACMPSMLCVPVPEGVELAHAAFGTLGAIALHAARIARPELGERFAVLGLGVIGQLVAQVLRAHGARVAAFDLVQRRADVALACGAEAAFACDPDEQVRRAMSWTDGRGVDGVIVAAQSADDAIMASAALMCRSRARVVATGLVPFSLPRHVAYEKELELRISRSTGPGRHDPSYELGGADYPFEHVRWTLARNVEAFLQLVRDGRACIEPLVTRRLRIEDGASALAPANGSGEALGILLEYGDGAAPSRSVSLRAAGSSSLSIAVIGAGRFARGTLLPELARLPDARIRRIVAATGLSATEAAKAHGAEIAGTDVDEALADEAVTAVVIATRHDAHASLVARALRAGKHVFVEKPLSLTIEGVDEIEAAARSVSGVLMVGFNRRWSAPALAARAELSGRGPVAVAIRVASPPLPPDHWLLDPRVGGGRLVGEGCHFLDLASFLAGDPEIASASSVPCGPAADAGYALQVLFADGSAAQVLCTTGAKQGLPKERVEAHAGGVTVTIDDFTSATVRRDGRETKLSGRGKGHAEELAAFAAAVRSGVAPVPLDVTLRIARATLQAL